MSDFNNDGFADLVVGIPGESPGGDPQSGSIAVLLGSSNGLVGSQIFEQESLDLGSNERGDSFGEALAVGDFDNDGFDDVVVGIPGESPGGDPRSGAIAILRGSSSGLIPSRILEQESLNLGSNERNDSFGEALAVGDFDNDGFDDVVVGIPGESPGGDPQSGAIAILTGSSNGLVASRVFEQENLDLGSNESGDAFGEALAVGDFNNDGFDDLAVGIPGESPGGDPQSGAIAILTGTSNGLVASRILEQESLNLGSNERGDLFGAALTVGDFNDDGFDDLVVGAPGESPGGDPRSGAIAILRGSNDGLTGSRILEQESLDLGSNNQGDLFGAALASSRDDDDDTEPPIEPPVEPDPLPEGQLGLYRFRNANFSTGTYIFVGRQERDNILNDPNLSQSFVLEGNGNRAFVASTEAADDLTAIYRLRNLDITGSYLFVGIEEYDAIFANDSNQRNKWVKEGLDSDGGDIPEFYVYGVGADRGQEFNRFQNTENNTFLFAGESETEAINNDPNLSAAFINQGVAFESL